VGEDDSALPNGGGVHVEGSDGTWKSTCQDSMVRYQSVHKSKLSSDIPSKSWGPDNNPKPRKFA
jgi:hypothetical protein